MNSFDFLQSLKSVEMERKQQTTYRRYVVKLLDQSLDVDIPITNESDIIDKISKMTSLEEICTFVSHNNGIIIN